MDTDRKNTEQRYVDGVEAVGWAIRSRTIDVDQSADQAEHFKYQIA
jgi:hypothetical protein